MTISGRDAFTATLSHSKTSSTRRVPVARERAVISLLIVLVMLLVAAHPANAEKSFLERDGAATSAYMYGYSDGGDESPYETPGRWELPGPFSLLPSQPTLQSLAFGPTFRNEETHTEVGGAAAYVNSRFAVPFQFSVETTWVRRKREPSDNRNFRRVRLAGDAEVWQRSSNWEGTAFALTGFFDNQNSSFSTFETGIAVTEAIGRRLSITGNAFWRRAWVVGGPILDAPVGVFGTSYNFGAGVRFGGFYEIYNKVFFSDDWGMFLSYQFLPWAEFIVDGGKFQFVRARLLLTYPLETP